MSVELFPNKCHKLLYNAKEKPKLTFVSWLCLKQAQKRENGKLN